MNWKRAEKRESETENAIYLAGLKANDTMETIGIMGGMSWNSTLHYYKAMNEHVYGRLGGLKSIEAVIYSVDFARIDTSDPAKTDWPSITRELTAISKKIETAGAAFLIITANTIHKIADQIQSQIGIPILHIADPTADAIKSAGMDTVALLGTKATMEEPFYRGRLEKMHGIKVLVPKEKEREFVHGVIFEELVKGKVNDSSAIAFRDIIDRMAKRGAQGTILGCTEIGMLIRAEDVKSRIFDTTLLHAKAAVDMALDPQKLALLRSQIKQQQSKRKG